ncbi:hypothetical protein CL617_03395 [archaeon]|nr:hypothetical protein [archaeon]|tara:strand:+ start:5570 stop:6847 length:1278 start_codon:yes stop_codon:yes gene_type:complete
MIKKILKAKRGSLVKDNATLFIATFIGSAFGYLFHFFVARLLGPSSYGILGSLLSILYILTIPFNTIQTAIARFTSEFNSKKEEGKIAFLLRKSTKKMFIAGVVLSIILILLTPSLKSFLKIESSSPFIVLSFITIFVLLLPIIRGVMQGLQDFNKLGLNLILEGVFKFGLGVLFVLIGLQVNGAVGAIIASFGIPFFIGFYNLRKYLKIKEVPIEKTKLYKYSVNLLILLSALTIFYSIDVLLVKHYFSSKEAGFYAAASLLGKVIFFGTLSITQVMFAKVSDNLFNKKAFKRIMYQSLLVIGTFGLGTFLFYILFPNFTINLFVGQEFAAIKPYIGKFAIIMTLFSLFYALSFYHISLNRNKFILLIILADIVEIALITQFHNSIEQVVNILLYIVLALFTILFIYTILKKDDKTFNSNPSIQ